MPRYWFSVQDAGWRYLPTAPRHSTPKPALRVTPKPLARVIASTVPAMDARQVADERARQRNRDTADLIQRVAARNRAFSAAHWGNAK